MGTENKYGLLLNNSIKIHRQYFREMVKLIGIHVIYRAPKKDKHWTTYGELESNYQPPILVACIFDGNPTQYTMKKLGWVSELQDVAIISVDYDLPDLQVGALFIVPSGLDDGKGRLFRVSKMSTDMVYPSSITCELVPEYEDVLSKDESEDYSNDSFKHISREFDNTFDYDYSTHLLKS